MKRYNIHLSVIGLAMAALTFTACSDEWDDHYKGSATDINSSSVSLWNAILQDPNLSNFARVATACGYDKALASSQVFTVFAPTNDNFSSAEADAWIQTYQAQKGRVDDDENTTIKEFLQNHITLYNHSVSSQTNDSITLMNGKHAKINTNSINSSPFLTTNRRYSNGVLFTVSTPVVFFPNVFEYMRKNPELDSLASFFYNEKFYRRDFLPELSVPGGIEDGKTVYLDSVFEQQNDLFEYNAVRAYINREDSTYWMLAPTNNVWRNLIEEYEPYFVYEKNVLDRDSMMFTNPRLAIVKGTVFSRTNNKDAAIRDSLLSTNAVSNGTLRRAAYGADSLHYYQYNKPYEPNGVFTGTQNVECSNGTMMVANDWKIDKQETFFQQIIVEAEGRNAIKEIEKVKNSKNELEETANAYLRNVTNDNKFYNKVSNNYFVEFEATKNVNPGVTFNITNVLSNIGYDIYVVTAPALANDSNATEAQRLPTVLSFTINYNDADGVQKTSSLLQNYETQPDIVDAILVAEDFKFPTATWGLEETEPRVTLTMKCNVRAAQLRSGTHMRTMCVDCILLKPHVNNPLN